MLTHIVDYEAERQAQVCATRAEEAHIWAWRAWQARDIPEAQACSMQEISWRKAALEWGQIARGEYVPPPEPVPVPVKEVKKRVYKPRPKTGGHWPPSVTVSRW